MRRARPGVGSELLPVALILLSLAGTLGLVMTMHRKSVRPRTPAAPKVLAVVPAAPTPEPPLPPPPVVVQPPPPPPSEDPTKKALARLAVEEERERLAARAADRKAEALEKARQAAVAESERWRRREAMVRAQVDGLAVKANSLEHEADALAAERDALARERDAARAALAKARSKDGGYAVLPHRSANGTWQRPVMIECRDGQAVLQPGGPSFTLMDMSPVLNPRSSPLVAAAARELIKVHRSTSPDGSPVTPYIYFVVRPDGIRPYYQARAQLEPLGIAFGYELVNQDWEIEFPDFDDLENWDGTASPRRKEPAPGGVATGPEGAGSGGASGLTGFTWPTDRPANNRGSSAPDPLLWPTHPPGGGAGGEGPDLAGRPGGLGGPVRGLAGTGPGGAPPRAGSIDADGLIREGLAAAGGGRAPSPIARPLPGPDGLRRGTGSGRDGRGVAAGETSGLSPLGSEGLPGLDRTGPSGNGPGQESRPDGRPGRLPPVASGGSGTDPDRLASGKPGAPGGRNLKAPGVSLTGKDGGPNRVTPSPGDGMIVEPPAGNVPLPPGRVRIDPSLLARANDEDVFGDSPSPSADGARAGRGSGEGPRAGGAGSPSSGQPAGDSGPQSSGSAGSQAANGVGLPSPGIGQAGGKPGDTHPKPSRASAWPTTRPLAVEVPLDLVVACGRDGVVVHPGGYRLSPGALRAAGTLKRDLETIVRNHELIDPMVRPRPRVQFLIEPGGSDTYWEARRQTVLAGLDWPVTIQVAGTGGPQVFPKERF